MHRSFLYLFLSFLVTVATAEAERINHEGRILGPLPAVTAPVLFNSPEADAIVAAMQIMPVDSPWNEDVSRLPMRTDSAAMITQIKTDLSASRQTLRPFYEMNYVLVPDDQPRAPINFFNYADESDLDGGNGTVGLYPLAPTTPVETWPVGTGNLTLDQWQRDVNNTGGDRHAIMVAPGANAIWETWLTKLVGNNWQASNGAKFILNSNALRPAGWTSGDAAGLPMFPAVVRYDECERGVVEHALRLVVAKTRRAYIYPATHYASSISATSTQYPAMGQRLRLHANFVIPANWSKEEKAVLNALKKYGAIVADNGNFFSISVCPDDRFASNTFAHLSSVDVNNFEVVETTTASGGPRSPGAPSVDAGADLTVQVPATLQVSAAVNDPSGSAAVQWKEYSGPGMATLVSPNQSVTEVNLSAPGVYTLLVSVSDGLHAVAYDAVIVTALSPASVAREGNDLLIAFATALNQHYRLEQTDDLLGGTWLTLADNLAGTGAAVSVRDAGAAAQAQRYYRLQLLP
ncbi:MAG: PKD domain-containing protein [Chthoniobacterales bacterium]